MSKYTKPSPAEVVLSLATARVSWGGAMMLAAHPLIVMAGVLVTAPVMLLIPGPVPVGVSWFVVIIVFIAGAAVIIRRRVRVEIARGNVVIRNRWRTVRLPLGDITSVEHHLWPFTVNVWVLRVRRLEGPPVNVHVTISGGRRTLPPESP